MMTMEHLDALLTLACVRAQQRMADLVAAGAMPLGYPLYCRVMWPKAHKGEHFLLVGSPTEVVNISDLSIEAARRIAKVGERFADWWGVQDIHEQFAFTVRAEVRVLHRANAAGLALVP